MLTLRRAEPRDLTAVRDLFVEVYGQGYGRTETYDPEWLERAFHRDSMLILVAETADGRQLLGTITANLSVSRAHDQQALLGRLVVKPTSQGGGVGRRLFSKLLETVSPRAHVVFGEARTVHDGSQKLCESERLAVVGFLPMAVRQLGRRESFALYLQLLGPARALRRPGPQVISEAAALSRAALSALGLPDDVTTVDDVEGWQTDAPLELEPLDASRSAPLLRIERGRVKGREVFGSVSLAQGLFQVERAKASYLVARQRGAVVGGIGFTFDANSAAFTVLELIAATDALKGTLLAAAERLARQEHQAAFVSVDVSAYAPGLQRTLLRLGFVPAAHFPAMVFDGGQRLDVLRFCKLNVPYALGELVLRPGATPIKQLVDLGFEKHLDAEDTARVLSGSAILRGLSPGELADVARLGTITRHAAGTTLLKEGDDSDSVMVLLAGSATVSSTGGSTGQLGGGQIFGEMGLVMREKRSATVTALEPVRVATFEIARLEHLVGTQPRLGLSLMRSFARGLSEKVRLKGSAGAHGP